MAKRKSAIQTDLEEWLAKCAQLKERLNSEGAEVHVRGPVAPPIGYSKQPSLTEMVREMVKSEKLREAVREAGYETMEESEDFDVEDDYDPTSPWENDFDPPLPELIAAGREIIEARKKENEEKRALAELGPRKSTDTEKGTPEA